ncbi:hypothetical protein [Starkeya nomas]|nr:hypothetical protein [Starkeya nomas]
MDEYEAFEGQLEEIMFPKLTATEVVAEAKLLWNGDLATPLTTG